MWSTVYQAINRANTVIARVPAIPMDNDLKARYVAEAKFMRGFYYFTLVRLFGGAADHGRNDFAERSGRTTGIGGRCVQTGDSGLYGC